MFLPFNVAAEKFTQSLTLTFKDNDPPSSKTLSDEGHREPSSLRGTADINGFSRSTTGHLTAYYFPS